MTLSQGLSVPNSLRHAARTVLELPSGTARKDGKEDPMFQVAIRVLSQAAAMLVW